MEARAWQSTMFVLAGIVAALGGLIGGATAHALDLLVHRHRS